MSPIAKKQGLPGLRAAREAKGFTQHQLEGLVGAAGGSVQRWETGERDPSVWAALALAQALETTVEALCREPGMAAELSE